MRERGSDMFYQFSLELVSMLARNASLPSIVQYVDQMLGKPLMITDETFGVLAYSQNRPAGLRAVAGIGLIHLYLWDKNTAAR